jgi:hypothetical protein
MLFKKIIRIEMSKTVESNNIPQIPTSVPLSEVYGELGNGLGWSLERTKFHTDLSIIGDPSDNEILSDFTMELEVLIQNNPSTLLTDLHERKTVLQKEFYELRLLLLRVLRMKANLNMIDGATHKDIANSVLHTGIVFLLENGKICDSPSVNILNTMILGHENVKTICRKLLISYAKLMIVTDVLVKCIMMAKMTGQVQEEI